MTLVANVRNTLAQCVVGGMSKEGCSISLADVKDKHVIVDLDKLGSPLTQAETRCDYLYVADGAGASTVAVIELKSGALRPDSVGKQLQAGATAAEKLVAASRNVHFYPIAATGSVTKAGRKRVRMPIVQFHGTKAVMRRIKCGAKLLSALR